MRTNAPEVARPLPTQTVLSGTASEPLDLTPYFHDPDGDPLTYAAVSSNPEVATGMVGIDWVARRWRTGLALAMSRGSGGYSAAVHSGEIESKLTGLFP